MPVKKSRNEMDIPVQVIGTEAPAARPQERATRPDTRAGSARRAALICCLMPMSLSQEAERARSKSRPALRRRLARDAHCRLARLRAPVTPHPRAPRLPGDDTRRSRWCPSPARPSGRPCPRKGCSTEVNRENRNFRQGSLSSVCSCSNIVLLEIPKTET
jgi:hypothetical protein